MEGSNAPGATGPLELVVRPFFKMSSRWPSEGVIELVFKPLLPTATVLFCHLTQVAAKEGVELIDRRVVYDVPIPYVVAHVPVKAGQYKGTPSKLLCLVASLVDAIEDEEKILLVERDKAFARGKTDAQQGLPPSEENAPYLQGYAKEFRRRVVISLRA